MTRWHINTTINHTIQNVGFCQKESSELEKKFDISFLIQELIHFLGYNP